MEVINPLPEYYKEALAAWDANATQFQKHQDDAYKNTHPELQDDREKILTLLTWEQALAGCGYTKQKTMREVGNEIICSSPFREDKNPSFSMSKTKKWFYDYATNRTGTKLDLIAHGMGITPNPDGTLPRFREILEKAASICGHRLKPRIEPGNQQQGIRSWGPIKPISSLGAPEKALSFTEEMIPLPWREWVVNSAKLGAVPLEMIAIPAMVGFGSLIGRKVFANLHPDGILKTPANLWGALVRDVSERKTTALNLGLAHFLEVNKELERKYAESAPSRVVALKEIELKIAALDKDFMDAFKNKGDTSRITNQKIELEERRAELKKRKRLMTQDSTVEAFQIALADNPNGLLLYKDELVGWIQAMTREGRQGERQFHMECYNGTSSSYTVIRVGREDLIIKNPTESVIGGIQPGPLKALVDKANNGAIESDGFIQRFQLLVYPDDEVKSTLTSRLSIGTYNIARSRDTYKKAYDYSPPLDHDGNTLTILTLDDQAQERFYSWAKELDAKISNKDQPKSFIEHISKYPTLLSRLTLNIHMIQQFDKPQRADFTDVVNLETLNMAIEWCRVLETHAKKSYGISSTTLRVSTEKLLKIIKEGKITDGMTLRQIQKKGLRGLESSNEVSEACEDLEDMGILQLDESKVGKTRGKKSVRVLINPEILSTKAN